MRAIGDQVEQVSVMNKLLNNALRAKGYAEPDIKMVLTDVTDPNETFYTDTLTNTGVFDRKMLASLDRDKILNILGHEFGHYSKEDNKTGNQTIANYSGDKLEDRTKTMVAKEATEDTLASIRNNPNVITGDEGKKLAESIPMDRREYRTTEYFVTAGGATHIVSGVRGTVTKSLYHSVDYKNDREYKYTANTVSVGAGTDDLSAAIGVGFYFADNPEEIQELSTSIGGSITLFGWSVGLDALSKGNYDKDFLKKIKNIEEGVRFYVGKSLKVSKIIVPAKIEKHVSLLDIGSVNIIKDTNILDYWKNENIPSGARLYYKYYYKEGDKNGQYKNERKYPYVIFFIRFSLVSIYWMHMSELLTTNTLRVLESRAS